MKPAIQKEALASPLVDHVANWLMKQALAEADLETLAIGCCERLFATGIPLVRGYFAFPVLHPLHRAIGITWSRGHGSTSIGYAHVPGGESDPFERSPHFYMLQRELDVMRIRLCDDNKQPNFPILDDLRAEGVTDYAAFAIGVKSAEYVGGMIGSWATDRRDGFTDAELSALLRIQERLAVACKLALNRQLMQNIANTYLGPSAGRRVLDGQIKRGDAEAIEAAIWYSDLRGSTHMADILPPQSYIDTLNTYFDATGGAVHDAGGEILSFIGDGLLAIFPIEDAVDRTEAARRAAGAARDALARMEEVNTTRLAGGEEALHFGIALHMGQVTYGNVGVPDRLTFSAFGAAVNEVVRLEELTKSVDEWIVASESLAALLPDTGRVLGTFALRGVERHVAVHALLERAASAA